MNLQNQNNQNILELRKISLANILQEDILPNLQNVGDSVEYEMLYNKDINKRDFNGNEAIVLLPEIKFTRVDSNLIKINYTYEKRKYGVTNQSLSKMVVGENEYEEIEDYDIDITSYNIVNTNEDELILKDFEFKEAFLEDFENWL